MMDESRNSLILESGRLANAGDFGADALEVNSRLSELCPTAEVRMRYAGCLEEAGRFEEARGVHLLVLEGSRDKKHEETIRGRIRTIDEQLKAASTHDFGAAWARAQELKLAAEPRLALIWHERTTELFTTRSQGAKTFMSMAATLRTLRRFKDAVTAAQRSIEIDRDPRTNLGGYATYIGALGDTRALAMAVQYANKLLAANPHDQVALSTAGAAFHALGIKNNDATLLEKAARCKRAAMAIASRERRQ